MNIIGQTDSYGAMASLTSQTNDDKGTGKGTKEVTLEDLDPEEIVYQKQEPVRLIDELEQFYSDLSDRIEQNPVPGPYEIYQQ